MYTLRIFELEGHQDTSYATVDEAFGAVYVEPVPDPTSLKIPLSQGFAIYEDGVCMHFNREGMNVGDPL